MTNLLQISSKYGIDTTLLTDHTGKITAQVHHVFEPEDMNRTWTIEHWQLAMAGMLHSRHRDQNGHSQNVSGKHCGKPWRYTTIDGTTSVVCQTDVGYNNDENNAWYCIAKHDICHIISKRFTIWHVHLPTQFLASGHCSCSIYIYIYLRKISITDFIACDGVNLECRSD